jgi:hypothetical protein
MARTTSFPGSEFNEFLFAPIGEDANGMPISVLSALARLDIDPWQEATALARLPGRTAIQRLAASIAALPDGPSAHRDPEPIATRLIALLPRTASVAGPSRSALPRAGASAGSGADATPNSRTVLFMLFMACLLGVQFIMASHQASVPADGALASTSSPAVSRTSPTSYGR